MIRRPINERFAPKVLDGTKTTTIRDKPWPVGQAIMLFRWSGRPYRSPQVEVAVIVVDSVIEFPFHKRPGCDVGFCVKQIDGRYIYETEGFDTHAEFLAWFNPLVPVGETVVKYLMKFQLHDRAMADHARNIAFWSNLQASLT